MITCDICTSKRIRLERSSPRFRKTLFKISVRSQFFQQSMNEERFGERAVSLILVLFLNLQMKLHYIHADVQNVLFRQTGRQPHRHRILTSFERSSGTLSRTI